MNKVRVTIPGKVMLSGEYAVLRGEPALAVAVDRHMTIEAEAGDGETPILSSDLWAGTQNLDENSADYFHRAVAGMIWKTGVVPGRVSITSDLNIKHGLGTSSALRLGVSMALRVLAGEENGKSTWAEAAENAIKLQRAAQGYASGYDVMTQWHGGLIRFVSSTAQGDGYAVDRFATSGLVDRVHVVGGGQGAPTATMIQAVRAYMDKRQNDLMRVNSDLTNALTAAIEADGGDWRSVYQAAGEHRKFMAAAPEQPGALLAELGAIAGCDESWSVKTTGAGGEDALLLFGEREAISPALKLLADKGWERLPVSFTDRGGEVSCL